jgi:hypothetical protein
MSKDVKYVPCDAWCITDVRVIRITKQAPTHGKPQVVWQEKTRQQSTRIRGNDSTEGITYTKPIADQSVS